MKIVSVRRKVYTPHYYPRRTSIKLLGLWDTNTGSVPLYQPRALCAVAPHLLPGLRCEEDFW
eukprot:scaffold124896_cov72-Phaeocystis_antarctica.AAC.1